MRRLISRHISWLVVVFVWLGRSDSAAAKELDQFSDRLAVLHYYAGGYRALPGAPGPAQVDAVLDAKMNQLLDEIAERLSDHVTPDAQLRDEHVRDVFQHSLLPELITPYEEWVKHEAKVPLYKVVNKGIYGHAVDYDDMRMAWYIEASPIIQVAGVLIGLDKLGHFLAQGFQYYHYLQTLPHGSAATRYDAVRRFAHEQEVAQLGLATGSVYSFADLASNWQGMLFFLALFQAADVEGEHQAPFFALDTSGHYRRVREFHWRDFISSDWDEALNPSGVESTVLYGKLVENFRRRVNWQPSICEDYRRDPAAFFGPSQPLRSRERYGLPNARAFFALDVRTICRAPR